MGIEKPQFEIPSHLSYHEGPFSHQGEAVSKWCEAGHRGVLEMATGSGKTITAMICARKLYTNCRPLLIVVAAPYVPLIQQWCEEIESFGIRPINLTEVSGGGGRARRIGRVERSFRTPEHVNPEAISARLEHGVLEIVLPKTTPETPDRLEIKID